MSKKITKSTVKIREIELEDLPTIFNLGELVFTPGSAPMLYRTWDEYELVGFYESDGEYSLAAEIDGEIVGFILGTVIEKYKSAWSYGYIVWIATHPEKQGLGIGKALLDHLTKIFVEDGVRMMIMDTAADNQPAINFFNKNGFHSEHPHVYLAKNLSSLKKSKNKKTP